MTKENIYAIQAGQGFIVDSWEQCKKLTDQTDIMFQKFDNLWAAKIYLGEAGFSDPVIMIGTKEDVEKVSKEYTAYTDGGCDSNPGGTGGYGVVILKNGREIKRISGGVLKTTNNRMEILAVIKALQEIPNGSVVKVISDSQYVVKTMNGLFSEGKNHDLWRKIHAEADRMEKVTYKWVRGHNGNTFNEICDQLATEGREKAEDFDAGYKGKSSSGPTIVKITVPDNLAGLAVSDVPDGYLNPSCKSAISSFHLKKDRSFRDYADLRTGGNDGFSGMMGNTLVNAVGRKEITDFIFSSFNSKDAAAACRWYLRGLTVAEACRKQEVDIEVRVNALKKKGI